VLREGVAAAIEPRTEAADRQLAESRSLADRSNEAVLSLPRVARGGLAVLDQGLFAGTHFVIGVLLARWMSDAGYGAFSVAYALLLLVGTVHTALLSDPLLALAPSLAGDAGRRYRGALLWGHLGLTLPATLLLIVLSVLPVRTGWLPERTTLLALALAAPMALLPWLARRSCYAASRPGVAAAGGVLYLVVSVCLLVGVREGGWLSPASALLTMGLSGAVAGGALLLAPGDTRPLRPTRGQVEGTARDHWAYGRWLLASLPLAWLCGHIYYLVLPVGWGLAESGRMKALMNLALPALHAIAALGSLAVPFLARGAGPGGERGLRRSAWVLAGAFVSGAVLYAGVLLAFRDDFLLLLYSGRYADASFREVMLVGSLPIAASLGAVLGAVLRAARRTRGLFLGMLGAALATIVVGLPLAAWMGMVGALTGLLVSSLASVAVFLVMLRAPATGREAHSCS
jgi:O-antigen/teichoic acid export membrane protein